MSESYVSDPRSSSPQSKSQAAQNLEDLRAQAGGRAHDLTELASEKAQQWVEAAEDSLLEAKLKAQEFLKEGEAYVRENPGKSVMTALGVGFVLGLLFRR